MQPPLHTLNPTTRFTQRAADYARYRPTYPPEAVDAILGGLGSRPTITVADIGAGTGISSRWIAGAGVRVIAIEPNASMRQVSLPHPLVEWRDARAEATGLPDASVDVVLSAQAFHWFNPTEALAEFARILRPRGRFALVWNEGDRSDPLTAAYYEAVAAAAGDAPVLKVRGVSREFWDTPLFREQRELTFSHKQVLTEDGLVGRALSASYVPREGPRAEQLMAALRAAFHRHAAGCPTISLVYITRLFLAERA